MGCLHHVGYARRPRTHVSRTVRRRLRRSNHHRWLRSLAPSHRTTRGSGRAARLPASARRRSTRPDRNRIHALIYQVDPEYHLRLPALRSAAGVKAVLEYTTSSDSPIDRQRVAAIRRLAQQLHLVLQQADELAREIRKLSSPRYAPLTRLCGINLLTAGAPWQECLDRAVASPPKPSSRRMPVWRLFRPSSANHLRHRLNRGGNRRLNAATYRIVLTQAHHSPAARKYLARRVAEGKTKREAFRALKRHIVRAIWHLWQECLDSARADDPLVQAAACTQERPIVTYLDVDPTPSRWLSSLP